MTPALVIALVLLTPFVIVAVWMHDAPAGWEDRRGFHYGNPPRKDE